jgi:hypothetical protein
MSAEKKRKRRTASDEAHAWARNLRLGNPYAKSILRALALYVDEAGRCFVGIGEPGEGGLVDDCDLSVNTVRNRLTWLETIGAIVRLPAWIDENGVRTTQPSRGGRRTTDEIRLLTDPALVDEIEARARGESDGENAEPISPSPQKGLSEKSPEPSANSLTGLSSSASDVSPSPQEGLSDGQPVSSPLTAPRQPSHSREGLISEPEPLTVDSPPTPPSGGSDAVANDWKDFERDWQEPILRQSLAQQVWSAFSPDEKQLARKAARGYVAWRRRQRKPPNVINAHTFLKETDAWAGFAALAANVPPQKTRTMIAAESAEFAALSLCCAIAGAPAPEPLHGHLQFVGDVPAGAAAMAALPHDRAQWIIVEKETPLFMAWCTRVQEWTGRWPEPRRIWLDQFDRIVPSAREAYCEPGRLPRCKNGLLVPPTPTGFPPAKKATGPPSEAA